MNTIIKFFKETFNRLFTGESPYFFRLWKRVALFAQVLTGLPVALTQFAQAQDITLPEWIISWGNSIGVIAAALIFFGAYFGLNMTTKEVTAKKMPLSQPTKPQYGE